MVLAALLEHIRLLATREVTEVTLFLAPSLQLVAALVAAVTTIVVAQMAPVLTAALEAERAVDQIAVTPQVLETLLP